MSIDASAQDRLTLFWNWWRRPRAPLCPRRQTGRFLPALSSAVSARRFSCAADTVASPFLSKKAPLAAGLSPGRKTSKGTYEFMLAEVDGQNVAGSLVGPTAVRNAGFILFFRAFQYWRGSLARIYLPQVRTSSLAPVPCIPRDRGHSDNRDQFTPSAGLAHCAYGSWEFSFPSSRPCQSAGYSGPLDKNDLPLNDLDVSSRQLRTWSQSGWGPSRAKIGLPRCKKRAASRPDIQPRLR